MLNNFIKRVPKFSKKQLLKNDFFDAQGKYDIIIEQTFFCGLIKTKEKIILLRCMTY